MPIELLDLPEEQEESTPAYLARLTGGGIARGLETVAGIPGSIAAGTANLVSAATGGRTPNAEQLAQKDIAKGIPSWLAHAPTPSHLREGTKALTGNTFESKTPGEEGFYDIAGDAATLLLGGGTKALAQRTAKALGVSTLGNIAKWGTESITDSPILGGTVKLATMLAAGTLGTRSELNSLRKTSYEDAFKKLPETARFKFSPEANAIDKIIRRVSRGTFPDRGAVVDQLSKVRNLVNPKGRYKGTARVKEIIDAKQGINEYIRENASKLAPSAKRELQDAVGLLNKGIARYGKTNASFFNPYQVGEELTAGLRGIDYVGGFIAKHPALRKKMDNPFLGSLFKYGIGASSGGILSQYPVQTGAAVGALYGANQIAKTVKLFSMSSIARRAYEDAVKNGLASNVANFSKDLSKLEREYEKHYDDLEGGIELLD